MNWIKRLLGIGRDKSKESLFSIEYYPITKRYYPKYRDYYLQVNTSTGIVEKMEPYLFTWADHGETEKEAYKLITMFKEQRLKENVITIPKD